MLVLSRQRDETIMIGDEIEITVVDIRGDKIRLGITAPTRIAVHRKEVYEAIRKENEQAAEHAAVLEETDLGSIGKPIAPGPARIRRTVTTPRLTATPFRSGPAPTVRTQTIVRPVPEREPAVARISP
jgi:carbon storage regulator